MCLNPGFPAIQLKKPNAARGLRLGLRLRRVETCEGVMEGVKFLREGWFRQLGWERIVSRWEGR